MWFRIFSSFVLLCVTRITHADSHIANITSPASELISALLENYDPRATPPQTSTVRIQISLNQLVEVNTADQTITFNAWIRHYWDDNRLKWNPSEWGDVSYIHLPPSQVWYPDVLAYETLNEFVPNKLALVVVYSSGSLFISVNVMKTIACTMQLQKFPFDVQECKFTMGSWAYSGSDYDLKPRLSGTSHAAIDLGVFQQSNDISLQGVETKEVTFLYNCCPDPYPLIEYTLYLRREPLSYIYSVAIPMITATMVGFLGFLLSPLSGERVGLAITSLLTIIAIYWVADASLPALGIWTTMTKLYMLCTLSMTVTLAITIVNVSLFNIESRSGPEAAEKMVKYFDMLKKSDGSVKPKVMLDWLVICGVKPSTVSKVKKMMQRENSDLEKGIDKHSWAVIVYKISETSNDPILDLYVSVVTSVRKCLGMHEDSNLRRISKRHARRSQSFSKVSPSTKDDKGETKLDEDSKMSSKAEDIFQDEIEYSMSSQVRARNIASQCDRCFCVFLPVLFFILVIVTCYPMLQWLGSSNARDTIAVTHIDENNGGNFSFSTNYCSADGGENSFYASNCD